jgi:hypothetical protein
MHLFFQNTIGAGRIIIWREDAALYDQELSKPAAAKHADLTTNLDTALQTAKITWSDIRQISIVAGPGDFTPVRLICVIANTLANELSCQRRQLTVDDFCEDPDQLLATLKAAKTTERFAPLYNSDPKIFGK